MNRYCVVWYEPKDGFRTLTYKGLEGDPEVVRTYEAGNWDPRFEPLLRATIDKADDTTNLVLQLGERGLIGREALVAIPVELARKLALFPGLPYAESNMHPYLGVSILGGK